MKRKSSPQPAPEPTPKKRLWAVMKAHSWDKLSVLGYPLLSPAEGPQRFIPIFDTREQAIQWAGSDEHVVEMQSVQ